MPVLRSVDVCPEVYAFARDLERTLRANDYKGGWAAMRPREVLGRIRDELQEAEDALDAGKRSQAGDEALDIAAFALMLRDVTVGLPRSEADT